jgi:hypothetical protein
MNRFKSFFSSLTFTIGHVVHKYLYTGLSILVMAVAVWGLANFLSSNLMPALRNRDKLIAQSADARRSLVDARQAAEQSPADWRARLNNAQATLTASSNIFLPQTRIRPIIDALYQYAGESQVTIADMQTQPAASPTDSSLYNVTNIRLQVKGDSHQLVDFASRVKECSAKGFVVNSLRIIPDKTAALLTLDISLYASPMASEARPVAAPPTAPSISAGAMPTAPAAPTMQVSEPRVEPNPPPTVVPSFPTPTFMPIVPTLVPTPVPTVTPSTTTMYIVRTGDTMYSIARRFNTTVDAIKAANHLFSDQIRVGQVLVIPSH